MYRHYLRRFVPLAVFVALGFALAVNSVLLLEQRQEAAIKDQALHDIIQSAKLLDTARLESLLAGMLQQAEPDGQAAVNRAYAVFRNALDTWQLSPFLDTGSQTDFIKSRLAEAKTDTLETHELVSDLQDSSRVDKALNAVREIGFAVNQVQQMAENQMTAVWQESENNLRSHERYQSLITIALLVAALSWIGLLYRRLASVERKKRQAGFQAAQATAQLRVDPATGLMTQSGLAGKIRELQRNLSDTQDLYVLNIDVSVPWTGGGSASDAVCDSILAAVTDRIQNLISLNLTAAHLARASGNSFIIAMFHEIGSGITPEGFAKRLRESIQRPVVVKTGTFPVTSVTGIAQVDPHDRDPGMFLQNAQLAAAEEIRTGRRHIRLYTPSLRSAAERQLGIGQALLQALEQEDCLPHFQPQFDLSSGEIIGVEALARWYHPKLGWIAPSEVIPIAEQNGLIVPLERKILETACAQVQILPGEPDLAVNISVAHILNDDVPATVDEILNSSGLSAGRLKLEIAANSLPNSFEQVRNVLDALKALGIRLSLDNFGAPSAALSGVLQYQWDEVKIDTVLTGIAKDGKTGHELMSLALMSVRALGSRPVIEGIETVDQRDMLTALGCTTGQGYLFGGPMAIDDLKALFFSDQPNIAQLLL